MLNLFQYKPKNNIFNFSYYFHVFLQKLGDSNIELAIYNAIVDETGINFYRWMMDSLIDNKFNLRETLSENNIKQYKFDNTGDLMFFTIIKSNINLFQLIINEAKKYEAT